jgi:predicted RNA-binding Zn ribbon-like protein
VPAAPPEAADVERCLAFVNTLSARPTAAPTERLASYDALLAWATEAGVIRAEDAAELTGRARRRAAEADTVVARARELRELLHAVLVAAERGRAPAPLVLDRLAAYLAGWYSRGRLVSQGGTLQWVYGGAGELDRVLWELARSATRLIASPALTKVRPCAADDCGWWFVDETKNHSRRWCDMKICGNRAKARRFRARRS